MTDKRTNERIFVTEKFSGGWVGGKESDYSVCPRPFDQFYACFTPVYVGQDGLSSPTYSSLRRWAGMWSSTIIRR